MVIQADLLTASNREDILVDRAWNCALRNAIPGLFLDTFKKMRDRNDLKYKWLRFIPDRNRISDSFFIPVRDAVITGLKSSDCLRSENEDLRRPSTLLILPSSSVSATALPLFRTNT